MIKIDEEKCINCGKCRRACVCRLFELRDGRMQVKDEGCIKCGHCVAVCPQDAVRFDADADTGYEPVLMPDKPIEKEELLNFMKLRRSIRKFKDKRIEEDVMAALIEAGRYAPTAHNEQDTEYLVVEAKLPEVRDKIWESLYKCACAEGNQGLQENYKSYKNNVQEDSLFYGARQVLFIYADKEINGIIAASYIELLANAMELGAFYCGYATYGIEQDAALKKEYGFFHGKKLSAVLGIGYPDIKYVRSAPRNKAKIQWI